jgi:hypothetical protein
MFGDGMMEFYMYIYIYMYMYVYIYIYKVCYLLAELCIKSVPFNLFG